MPAAAGSPRTSTPTCVLAGHRTPDASGPRTDAPLRWLSLAQDPEATSEANLLITLGLVERFLARP